MDDKIFFDMFITFNDDKSEAYMNIRPNSRIDKDDLKQTIIEGFKQIKSLLKQSGISYGILPDKEILEQLKDYCVLPDSERKKDIYKIIIAKGHLPVDGEDSELIEHVKLKNELRGKIDDTTGNVDHRNLGFSERIIPKGKLILTLKKPTKGELGMNVLGEPLEPNAGQWKHKIKYDRKSIETEEDDQEIRYKSKKEGFLYKDSSKGYFVDEKVLTKAVDFKIGNIEGKEIEDSTVIVQGSSDVFEDSVKADFKVEAKKIKIKGNVGIGAIVKGDEIEIEGAIDKKAIVEGKKIYVNKFFGEYIKGNLIRIKEISSSKAIGDIVIIDNCLSSEITGKEVLVLNEFRGSKIISEKFIFVNSCKGGVKQELVIDSIVLPGTRVLIKEIKNQIEKVKKDIEQLEEKDKLLETKISQFENKIENILNRYFKFDPDKEQQQKDILKELFKKGEFKFIEKKFNIELEIGDIYTIQNYAKFYHEYEANNLELNKLNEKKEILENKLNEKLKADSNAMIIIKSIYGPMIHVKFKNLNLEHKFNKNIQDPVVVFVKDGKIKVENINKENKKIILEKFEKLITGDAFKIVKEVIK